MEFEDTRDAEDSVRGLDGRYVERKQASNKNCCVYLNLSAILNLKFRKISAELKNIPKSNFTHEVF